MVCSFVRFNLLKSAFHHFCPVSFHMDLLLFLQPTAIIPNHYILKPDLLPLLCKLHLIPFIPSFSSSFSKSASHRHANFTHPVNHARFIYFQHFYLLSIPHPFDFYLLYRMKGKAHGEKVREWYPETTNGIKGIR